MYPASTDKLQLVYIYDNTSHKDDEMKHDQDVNVAFLEPVGGDWISVAGNAVTTTDRSEVAKYYSASTKAWFADLGDGVHDGSGNDPRVSVLKIKPTEVGIRLEWKAVDCVMSCVLTSLPGRSDTTLERKPC
jgi:general stress protein 26